MVEASPHESRRGTWGGSTVRLAIALVLLAGAVVVMRMSQPDLGWFGGRLSSEPRGFPVAVLLVACAWAVAPRSREHKPAAETDLVGPPARLLRLPWLAALLAVAVFALARSLGVASGWAALPWVGVLAVVLVRLVGCGGEGWRAFAPRLSGREILGLAVSAGALLTLYGLLAGGWRFSFIGDELAFFVLPRDLARDGLLVRDWLFGMGVYGDNPNMMSIYQAVAMKLLGFDAWGFQMSAGLLMVFTLPGLYLLLRHQVRAPARAAVAATVGCAVAVLSQQLLVWSVQGKIHMMALPPLVGGLALVEASRARRSPVLVWAAGAVCGGAFMFNLLGAAVSGAACWVLLAWDAWVDLRRRRLRRAVVLPLLFLAGWVALAAPYLVQPRAVADAFQSKVIHHEGGNTVAERVSQTVYALVQPLHFRAHDHFMSGNVVDVVSALLFLAGLLAIGRHGSSLANRAALVLVAVAVMTSGLSCYTYPFVTRTFLLMVPVAMFATHGVDRLLPRGTGRRWAMAIGLIAAIAAISLGRLMLIAPYARFQTVEFQLVRQLQMRPDETAAVVVSNERVNPRDVALLVRLYQPHRKLPVFAADAEGLGALRSWLAGAHGPVTLYELGLIEVPVRWPRFH